MSFGAVWIIWRRYGDLGAEWTDHEDLGDAEELAATIATLDSDEAAREETDSTASARGTPSLHVRLEVQEGALAGAEDARRLEPGRLLARLASLRLGTETSNGDDVLLEVGERKSSGLRT